jgi:hypothetical protein
MLEGTRSRYRTVQGHEDSFKRGNYLRLSRPVLPAYALVGLVLTPMLAISADIAVETRVRSTVASKCRNSCLAGISILLLFVRSRVDHQHGRFPAQHSVRDAPEGGAQHAAASATGHYDEIDFVLFDVTVELVCSRSDKGLGHDIRKAELFRRLL